MNTAMTERAIKLFPCLRSRLVQARASAPASEARTYLRRLRAAEMAAWELSGGDYLRSKCADRVNAR